MKFLALLDRLFKWHSNGSEGSGEKYEARGSLPHFYDGQGNGSAYRWAGSIYTDEKAGLIILECLKSDSDASLNMIVESVTAVLPKYAPLSEGIATCGELILELAELPYQASSHQKLVRLLLALGDTLAFTEIQSVIQVVLRHLHNMSSNFQARIEESTASND